MKLKKSQFCKYVNKYKEMLEQEDKIFDALDMGWEWTPSEWIENYYDMLSDLCELPEDKNFGTFLDWFVFDTHFGKEDNTILLNNKKWVIDSPEILYDFIRKQQE